MNDADKFWEITAAVIPVLALAFVLEVRYLQLHRMGPFSRLNLALTHALTIFVLLASETAALIHLQGIRQAPWAEVFALYGVLTSLSVIVITPASRLLTLGLYSNTPADYIHYWKKWRDLREVRRDINSLQRTMRKGKALIKKIDRTKAKWEAKLRALPVVDLRTAWQNVEIMSSIEEIQAQRFDFSQSLAASQQRINKARRRVRKLEKKLVSHTGQRAKLISELLDKQAGNSVQQSQK